MTTKARRRERYDWALQACLMDAKNKTLTKADVHLMARRYQLHPAQERRLMSALRKEIDE